MTPDGVPELCGHLQDSEIDDDKYHFESDLGDKEPNSAGDEMVTKPTNNCLIIQGPIAYPRKLVPVSRMKPRKFTNTFEVCTTTEDYGSSRSTTWKAFKRGLIMCILLAVTFMGLVSPGLIQKMLGLCGFTLLAYVMYAGNFKENVASPLRVITWRLREYSDELKTGFISSPEFGAANCRWCLVIRQQHFTRGIQTSFGLIATNIRNNVEKIEANLHFSVTNSAGQDLVMDMKKLAVTSVFESEGDCGYSANVLLTRDQILDDQLQIKCRASFSTKKVGLLKTLSFNEQNELLNNGPRKVSEVGLIHPEICDCEPIEMLSESTGMMNFIQNPETKSFVWKIPDFETEILGTECWGIYSPQVVVNSHGICSIWRFKLVELHGTYRIHLQVRGLPRGVAQIMTCYTIELMDNFGDFVFPEGSHTRVVYPDYLSIWGTIRMPLYARQTLLTRFFCSDTGLTLRISLNVEPVENSCLRTLRGTNSCEWIVSRLH